MMGEIFVGVMGFRKKFTSHCHHLLSFFHPEKNTFDFLSSHCSPFLFGFVSLASSLCLLPVRVHLNNKRATFISVKERHLLTVWWALSVAGLVYARFVLYRLAGTYLVGEALEHPVLYLWTAIYLSFSAIQLNLLRQSAYLAPALNKLLILNKTLKAEFGPRERRFRGLYFKMVISTLFLIPLALFCSTTLFLLNPDSLNFYYSILWSPLQNKWTMLICSILDDFIILTFCTGTLFSLFIGEIYFSINLYWIRYLIGEAEKLKSFDRLLKLLKFWRQLRLQHVHVAGDILSPLLAYLLAICLTLTSVSGAVLLKYYSRLSTTGLLVLTMICGWSLFLLVVLTKRMTEVVSTSSRLSRTLQLTHNRISVEAQPSAKRRHWRPQRAHSSLLGKQQLSFALGFPRLQIGPKTLANLIWVITLAICAIYLIATYL